MYRRAISYDVQNASARGGGVGVGGDKMEASTGSGGEAGVAAGLDRGVLVKRLKMSVWFGDNSARPEARAVGLQSAWMVVVGVMVLVDWVNCWEEDALTVLMVVGGMGLNVVLVTVIVVFVYANIEVKVPGGCVYSIQNGTSSNVIVLIG
jgi:hypothetical protein